MLTRSDNPTTRLLYTTARPNHQEHLGHIVRSNQVTYNENYNAISGNNNSDLLNQEFQLISNIFLDIRVATDVCNNLFARVKDLETLLKTKINPSINTSRATANFLPSHLECGNTAEEGWIPVTDRRRHHRPPPMCPHPPPLPLRNAFSVLDSYENNFPSLEDAAAHQFQRREFNKWHKQHEAHTEASIPPLHLTQPAPRAPRKVFPPNQLKFKETECHVLDAPTGYAKAHSVDSTFHMSSGIAVDFKNEIGQVQELITQNKSVGDVAHVKDKNGDHILYMVAKRRHYYKPIPKFEKIFKSNYIKALYGLRKTCLKLKIKKLAIPRMGCNCDQLSWDEFIKPCILEIFNTVPIEILVCNSTPRTPRAQPKTPTITSTYAAPPQTPPSRKSRNLNTIPTPSPPHTPPMFTKTPPTTTPPLPPTPPAFCTEGSNSTTTLSDERSVHHTITPRSVHHSDDDKRSSIENSEKSEYTTLNNMKFYTPNQTNSDDNADDDCVIVPACENIFHENDNINELKNTNIAIPFHLM
jgi:hypothetical protein